MLSRGFNCCTAIINIIRELSLVALDFIRDTIKVLSIGTDRSAQTVLILQEQTDQGLYCFHFNLHLLDTLLHCVTELFIFMAVSETFSGAQMFRLFYVPFFWSSLRTILE